MTDTNKQIDELLGLIEYVYEAGYNAGDFGGPNTPKKADIIQIALSKLHDLMVRELINENERWIKVAKGSGLPIHHKTFPDRIKSLEATLNTKENTDESN